MMTFMATNKINNRIKGLAGFFLYALALYARGIETWKPCICEYVNWTIQTNVIRSFHGYYGAQWNEPNAINNKNKIAIYLFGRLKRLRLFLRFSLYICFVCWSISIWRKFIHSAAKWFGEIHFYVAHSNNVVKMCMAFFRFLPSVCCSM